MPLPFAIPVLGFKDYIIAGLGALCLLLAINTYLNFSFLFISWEGWKPKAHRFEEHWKSAEGRLKVSNGSIDRLETVIADLNAEALKRAEAFENIRELAAQDAQRLETEARRSQGQIERLRGLAVSEGKCAVPGELADALEGL